MRAVSALEPRSTVQDSASPATPGRAARLADQRHSSFCSNARPRALATERSTTELCLVVDLDYGVRLYSSAARRAPDRGSSRIADADASDRSIQSDSNSFPGEELVKLTMAWGYQHRGKRIFGVVLPDRRPAEFATSASQGRLSNQQVARLLRCAAVGSCSCSWLVATRHRR